MLSPSLFTMRRQRIHFIWCGPQNPIQLQHNIKFDF
uniref:Uncharacterized protein n=1 Tax=Arundo donax TaxID=35708 RepID=A0A0A9C4D9_ARUDO